MRNVQNVSLSMITALHAHLKVVHHQTVNVLWKINLEIHCFNALVTNYLKIRNSFFFLLWLTIKISKCFFIVLRLFSTMWVLFWHSWFLHKLFRRSFVSSTMHLRFIYLWSVEHEVLKSESRLCCVLRLSIQIWWVHQLLNY